jgi:hypothetical protein
MAYCHSDVNSALQWNSTPLEFASLKLVSCRKLFAKMVQAPDELPPSTLNERSDKHRAMLSHSLYTSMTSDDEKELLRKCDADKGEKAVLLEHLDHLVLALLVLTRLRTLELNFSPADAKSKLLKLHLTKMFDGTKDLLPSTIEELLKDASFRSELSLPQATVRKDGLTLDDILRSDFRKKCLIFRDAYEAYCKCSQQPLLSRKMGAYLGENARYPFAKRFADDIQNGKWGSQD